jgi:hypothetical protein
MTQPPRPQADADPSATAATRRILATLTPERRVPVFGLRSGDAQVLASGPVVGLFLVSLVDARALVVPAALVGLFVSVALVVAAPPHLTAGAWVRTLGRYYLRRPTHSLAADPERGTGRVPFVPAESTQEVTNIARAWPGLAAVERTDGTLEAMVELEPTPMGFALSADWAGVESAITEFVNAEVDFPVKLHVRTRPFPVETVVGSTDSGPSTEESSTDRTRRLLTDEYRRQRRDALAQSTHPQYFLGISVSPVEVYERDAQEGTPAERLAGVPLLGVLARRVLHGREPLSPLERRERMAEKLDARVETLQTELFGRLDGWRARRLATAELYELCVEFWGGESTDRPVRTRTAVGRQPRVVQTPRVPDGTIERRTARAVTRGDGGTVVEDDDRTATDAEYEHLTRLGESHADDIAPAGVEWGTRTARLDETWTQTLTVEGYPDLLKDGALSGLFELSDVSYALTIHWRPIDHERARRKLQQQADDLEADAHLEETVRGGYLAERSRRAAQTYAAVEGGTRVLHQSIYVTVRADDRESLRESVRRVRQRLREQPAGLTAKTAICAQDRAVQSAAPIGPDVADRSVVALGGAVGALLSSPHRPTMLEADGIELGTESRTGTPVVVDPFARANGYATFRVGDPGSGKSVAAKQAFLRTLLADEDRLGVILEPLGNWASVAEALGGQRVTVGGTLGVNPLDIRAVPASVQRTMGADASPFAEKLNDVLSFLTNFFAQRGVQLGERRVTLELALIETYKRAGITEDIETHSAASPTLRDLLDVLSDMIDEPEAFTVRAVDAEAEQLVGHAETLVYQLRVFDEGERYANIGEPTAFDLREESVLYLDLGQQEGSIGEDTGLLMQLLISQVYELAKETDREVVFVIDEARYVLKDAASLSFLETVFRHHRHHDLSIRLVTQTVDEFFDRSEAEAILDQCAVKQFHRLDGMDTQWAEEFGLNHAQMRFVQEALPGDPTRGYGEALVGVDGEWYGIQVRLLPGEWDVIEFDSQDSAEEAVPGGKGKIVRQ